MAASPPPEGAAITAYRGPALRPAGRAGFGSAQHHHVLRHGPLLLPGSTTPPATLVTARPSETTPPPLRLISVLSAAGCAGRHKRCAAAPSQRAYCRSGG